MEHDQLAAVGSHPHLGPVARDRGQAHVMLIELLGPLGVSDGDLDRTHTGPSGDRLGLHVRFLPRSRGWYSADWYQLGEIGRILGADWYQLVVTTQLSSGR